MSLNVGYIVPGRSVFRNKIHPGNSYIYLHYGYLRRGLVWDGGGLYWVPGGDQQYRNGSEFYDIALGRRIGFYALYELRSIINGN